MTHLPIPLSVLYAGLAGTALALIVATISNRWSPRVFFLLALRLAIGWHFLFEGLYKIDSVYNGPTEAHPRAFTSEPYFKVAPGPLGERMRKEFSNTDGEIASKIKAPEAISPTDFAKRSEADQAAKCPAAVASQFDGLGASAVEALKAESEKGLKSADANEAKAVKQANETEQRALKGQWTQEELDQMHYTADESRRKAQTLADAQRAQVNERQTNYEKVGKELIAALKTQPKAEMLAEPLEATLKALKTKADADLKSIAETEKKAIDDATSLEQRSLKAEWTDQEKAKIQTKAEAERKKAKDNADRAREDAKEKADKANELAAERILTAKATYARWVYGVDGRDCKVKGITGDVLLTAPQRIEHVEWLRSKTQAAEGRETDGLGNGNGTDAKRVAEFRIDAITAASDLARVAESFITDLKKNIDGGKVTDEKPELTRGQLIDRVTMWFLVVVGACLMGGLLTRLACLLATGFLVMTYLAHPPFPWYPLPPNTEGNPVFINKNVIEALALLVLACYPTGRWLGLDALILRPFCKYRGECRTQATT